MKSHLFLLLLFPAALQAQGVPVDCHMILGYQGFQGMIPQCFIDSAGQATIVLNGSSRLNWNNLHIAPGSPLTSLTITNGGHTVAIVDGGTQTQIDGPLSASGRLGLFTSNLRVGAGGNISAPQLLISALPAANADAWIATGSTTVEQTPGTTGTLNNRGTIKATQGNLTLIGATVQNEGRFGGPALMESSHGDLQIVAGRNAQITPSGATGHAQTVDGVATINNFGTMKGFTVHLQAVPRYEPGNPGLVQINITNGGIIQSNASGSGVHINTIHPTQPVVGTTSLLAGSSVITPNASSWPTSANVKTILLNDGEVLEPTEDEAPTVAGPPAAIPRLGGTGVVATGEPAPPLAVTYSALNSLPRKGPQPFTQNAASSVATRGNPSSTAKKKRSSVIKGSFFQIQYRN